MVLIGYAIINLMNKPRQFLNKTETMQALSERAKDGFRTGDARWKDIDDLIKRWKRRNPQGYEDNMAYVQEKRDSLKDTKFGEWTDDKNRKMGTRIGLAIHPELLNLIESFYPDFMTKKGDVGEFGKRYKQFQIPDKI